MKRSSEDSCGKCDGAHPTDECPYFPLPRTQVVLWHERSSGEVNQSAEANKRQREGDHEYLKMLSQEQRDEVLANMTYVKDPVDYSFTSDVAPPRGYVINYSQWYETMSEEYKSKTMIPAPKVLRNGDRLQFGDYRGVNSFYVLWLRRGSHANTDQFDTEHIAEVLRRSERAKCVFIKTSRETMPATELSSMPLMTKRSDKHGTHTNPDYNCYLFQHPDEFGYSPATVVSAAPLRYYQPEVVLAYIDPLLTHSESEHGRAIAEIASQYPAETFPRDYIGVLDENNEPSMVWERWGDDVDEESLGLPPNYIGELRSVMQKHFQLELEYS